MYIFQPFWLDYNLIKMTTNTYTGNHILVGLGGTGGKILRAFKMRMFEEFPEAEDRKKQSVAILYVDSTDEMMPKDGKARADFRVMGQDASFTQNEFLFIKSVDVEDILSHIGNYPSVKGIVDNVTAVKSAIGSLGEAAGQKRRAGRLLFAANATGYVNSLKNAYAQCVERSGDSNSNNIHIFAGLAGGTGSGAVVDAVLQARKQFPNATISVYAMIPEENLPKADMDQGRYYQNGYAAMNELNALQVGAWQPHDITGNSKLKLYNDRVKGVADGLTVYSNVNENGLSVNSLEELPKIVSDYIFARIFFVNSLDQINQDVVRAYNFENMDDFALEFDEAANLNPDGSKPVARTKKINSFGIKRVMYPELRVLKHITYTVGESILYQFKYNNWRENQGFVNEERNRDYRGDYLDRDNLAIWCLDEEHLTLDLNILETDTKYPRFKDYWHDKAVGYAEEAKKATCPLNELDSILNEFYEKHFREEGVESFYHSKERAIPEMAKEIRHNVEYGLFDKWKIGDISIIELQKVSKLILEHMEVLRGELVEKTKKMRDECYAIDQDRQANLREWTNLNLLHRMVGVGARRYADHQEILADMYTCKTRILALEFAKKLAAKVFVEFGRMDADISAFGQKINDAISETEKLIVAQRKVNRGLEDMRGAIIEVSEEETMVDFERDLKIDKLDMPNIARQLREEILPETDFLNFGQLANYISVDDVKDAFDIKLSEIVRTKHTEKADSDNKVLGLNILTQLQQKLKTDDDIKAFAAKIVQQSGSYLRLNQEQILLNLRNNEGNLSPQNPASINKKVILISIPSPDEHESLKRFADKLEEAFRNSINQSTARTNITINRKSLRKDELSVITVSYCFPMRAIEWMTPYKAKYEYFLNTGNPNTDTANAILLHTEGDGSQCPELFPVENAEEVAAERARQAALANGTTMPGAVAMPPIAGAVPPPIPGMNAEISLFLAIGGQQYGPYNRATCQQMVQSGQLTPQTLVWMDGMANWATAAQVPQLASLFAPQMPPPIPNL